MRTHLGPLFPRLALFPHFALLLHLALLAALPLAGSGCLAGGDQPDPPLLRVTSPQRSLIQDRTGPLVVTGTVAPNPTGTAVASVVVNDTRATIDADGTFTAMIDVPAGATLIHTVATDAAGGIATDTRSVLAGERRAPGSSIKNAIAASISAPAFAQIGDAAGKLIKSADLKAVIAPLNPIVHAGDDGGPDCLYAQAFVDTMTITDARIALAPVAGGLQLSATFDRPVITGHMQYALTCVNGQSNFEIKAASASLSGVLVLSIDGANGLTTQLKNSDVQLPGLAITASGIPGTILGLVPLEKVIQTAAPAAARLFVTPLLNKAIGTLTGPQKLPVLGQTLDLQVTPSAVAFDPSKGDVMLDMKLLIEGAERSPGFIFTPNGAPALDPGRGLALGIADDLANDALAQLAAKGLLNLQVPGTNAQVTMTSPPMLSADPQDGDGKLRLVLPDMIVMLGEKGRIAVNAEIPFAAQPADGGSALAIELGTPAIAIDSLDDVPVADSGFAPAIQATTIEQRGSIKDLLKNIPLPKVGGLSLTDTSITGGSGYVIVKTTLK
jgi:hypothetical protein